MTSKQRFGNLGSNIEGLLYSMYLLPKQAVAIILYAAVSGWRVGSFFPWLFQLGNLTQTRGGAKKICCFGINPHLVWEVTGRCNLKCIHCHTFGGEEYEGELSKEEGLSLIDEIARSTNFKTFVFAGGEPLVREDIFELMEHAKTVGLNVFLATNGTLITKEVAKKLKKLDIGLVIGLDAMDAKTHENIRGIKGSFDAVIDGIENCVSEGLYLHINIVASKLNLNEIEKIIDFGTKKRVYSYFIYNFVPSGRGESIKQYTLDEEELKVLSKLILDKQKQVKSVMIPVAFPEYWAYMLKSKGIKNKKISNFIGYFFGGCLAGGKGMIYVKPNGDVWPCPFLLVSAGNVKNEKIGKILGKLEKSVENLAVNKECSICEYNYVCGGCKARMKEGSRCIVK